MDAPGTYVAQLVVNDGRANSAPDTVTISTENSAPTASAGPNQSASVGERVQLNGSASSDPDNDPLTYNWSFSSKPNDSVAILAGAATVQPWFILDKAGIYIVQLIVNDGHLDSAPATVRISTENSPPIANAGPSQSAVVGIEVTLNGSLSYDPDGSPLLYQWGFTSKPEGSFAALADANTESPRFTPDIGGTYVIQLRVSDGELWSNTATVSVSTENSPPIANAGPDRKSVV